MEIKIIILNGLLFLSLLTFSFQSIKYIQENNLFKKLVKKLLYISERNSLKRREEKQKLRLEEGNVEDDSFINKRDLLIERSQIRKYIPFFNTEIYLALIVIFVFGGIIIGSLMSKWIIGLVVGLILSLLLYGSIHFLSNLNYEKIDKDILTFTNIIENMSGTNDDIVTIMGKTYSYLNKPLRYHIEDFYNEASKTGNIQVAFRKLEMKIENERVRDIIRNIEMCSRHEANYNEIIKDSRATLKDYLNAKQKRKAIISGGRKEILLCIALSGVMVYIFSSFTSNLFDKLTNSTPGIGILLYCVIIGVAIIKNLISFDKG